MKKGLCFGILSGVKAELTTLREEVTGLKNIIQQNAVVIEAKDIEIQRLEMELRLLRHKLYGQKSERVTDNPDTQTNLFNEAEATVKEEP